MAKRKHIPHNAMRGRASRPPAAGLAKGRPGRRKIPATSPLAADLAAIGERLTAAREARGLSGRALDRLSGVKNPGAIEHGRPLALSTAFKLADALGVRRAWLLLGEGPRDVAPAPAAPVTAGLVIDHLADPAAADSRAIDTGHAAPGLLPFLVDADAPLADDERAALALLHASGFVGAVVHAHTAACLVARGLAERIDDSRVLRLTEAGRAAATAPR